MNRNTSYYPAKVSLHQLRLMVHLGYGEAERAVPQAIDVSVDLFLGSLPHACHADGEGFLCYHELSNVMEEVATAKPYALIEFLGMKLAEAIEAWIAPQKAETGMESVGFVLRLDKIDAPVPKLRGGTSFTYTNMPEGLRP